MASNCLLKVFIVTVCVLGVLGIPNQENNERPVNNGKNECSGNRQVCNDGAGICVYRTDEYGNEGHKECVTSCGQLPTNMVPDNAEIVSPGDFDFDVENPDYMVEGATFEFACRDGFGSTCSNTKVICLPSGSWSEPALECRYDCGEPELTSPRTVQHLSGTLDGDVAVTECSDGAQATGDQYLICTYDSVADTGAWADGGGSCATDCGPVLNEIPFATRAGPDDYDTSQGAQVVWECDNVEGSITFTCAADGWTFSEPACPSPAPCAVERYSDGMPLIFEELDPDLKVAHYGPCPGTSDKFQVKECIIIDEWWYVEQACP